MGDRSVWAEYRQWNDAIAEEFFSGEYGGRPVYLDLEDDILAAIAARVPDGCSDARTAIFDVVAPTLPVASDGEGTFTGHLERLRAWRLSGATGWPPFVGVLAMLCLIAEEMAADEDFSARNYYGRLLQRLGEDPADARLRHKLVRDFGRQSHDLWEALNSWLLKDPEVRGFPTAFAFDYRAHIGRPLSQALLREADRADLLRLFEEWRLEPGNELAPGVMQVLLRDAREAGRLSKTLSRIARKPEALERLAEVGCAELAAWKGPQQASTSSKVSLIGALRRRPLPSLDISVVVGDSALSADVEVLLVDEAGEPMGRSSGFVEAPDEFGIRRVTEGLRTADALAARVEVTDGSRSVSRTPQVLLLLERRPDRGRLEEVGRAQLGGEYVLLVRDGLAGYVAEMLERAARPGWAMRAPQELRGVPDGWRAFIGVQLLAIPATERSDLAPLIPIGWTQLSFSGGLALPGPHAFLARRPPEVAVAVVETRQVHATLAREPYEEEVDLGVVEDAATWDLTSRGLEAGSYRLALVAANAAGEGGDDEQQHALASKRVTLYSPEYPLEQAIDPTDGYSLEDPLAALGAGSGGSAHCRGALVQGLRSAERSRVVLADALSSETQGGESEELVDLPPLAEPVSPGVRVADCLETGAHRMWEVDGAPVQDGQKPWRCIYCGVEKYFPTSLRRRGPRARRQRARASSLEEAAVDLPPVRDSQKFVRHEVLIEAICTVRSGSWGSFVRLVSQVDERPWAPRELGRLYSALGLIDVECSSTSLEPSRWQVAPPVLCFTTEHDAYLAGWRSPSLLAEIEALASQMGGSAHSESFDGWPLFVVSEVEVEDLRKVIGSVSTREFGEVHCNRDPGLALAESLPGLPELREALPSGSLPDRGCERYDPATGRWEPPTVTDGAGAFRSRRGAWCWWHADARGDVRVTESRVGKWLAASASGVPMLAYREAEEVLLTRRGSPLPGLYERAAALCSGKLPVELEGSLLGYRGVPAGVASHLASALDG